MISLDRSLSPYPVTQPTTLSPQPASPQSQGAVKDNPAVSGAPRVAAGEDVRRQALMAALPAKTTLAKGRPNGVSGLARQASPEEVIVTLATFASPSLRPALMKLVSPEGSIGYGGLKSGEEMLYFGDMDKPGIRDAEDSGSGAVLQAIAKACGMSVQETVDFLATADRRPSSAWHDVAAKMMETGIFSPQQVLGYDSTFAKERQFSLVVGY